MGKVEKIDVTGLKMEERCDLARMLFKCGYAVEAKKEKSGSKIKQLIEIRKAEG